MQLKTGQRAAGMSLLSRGSFIIHEHTVYAELLGWWESLSPLPGGGGGGPS